MLVATLHPQPDVPSSVRKLPASPERAKRVEGPNRQAVAIAPLISEVAEAVAAPQATLPPSPIAPPPHPVVVRAVAPERYRLQVTIGAETRAKLRRAQDLLRFTNRSADEADVIDRALTLLVAQLEKVKYGRTDRPRPPRAESRGPAGSFDPGSRHVPTHVRRAVSARDEDRSAFVGREGRCTETAGLQFHHRIPFADGGPTTLDNLELRCPAHNVYEAEQWFGPLFVRERGDAWGLLGLDQVLPGEKVRAVVGPDSSEGCLNGALGGREAIRIPCDGTCQGLLVNFLSSCSRARVCAIDRASAAGAAASGSRQCPPSWFE